VIAGLAFAAAAGVGLAQITTSEPSGAASAVTTRSLSTGTNGASDDLLDFEGGDDNGSTSTMQQTQSSTSAQKHETRDEGTGTGQEKVEICHMTGSGKSHTINIARPAVAAHVAHGDTEGACAATTTTAAVTTSAQTTTAHVKKHAHSSTHVDSSHATQDASHSSATHVSHGNSSHIAHAHPSHPSHASSGVTHGNGNGGGQGNGHNN
jgi:hypothetical protein